MPPGAQNAPRLASRLFLLTSLAPSRTSPARPPTHDTRAVATTVVRSSARPAPTMGDTCRQVSWLAARARRLHLPAGCRQWLLGRRSPLTVAGAAAALRPDETSHRVPFSLAATPFGPRLDRHAAGIEASSLPSVNRKSESLAVRRIRRCKSITVRHGSTAAAARVDPLCRSRPCPTGSVRLPMVGITQGLGRAETGIGHDGSRTSGRRRDRIPGPPRTGRGVARLQARPGGVANPLAVAGVRSLRRGGARRAASRRALGAGGPRLPGQCRRHDRRRCDRVFRNVRSSGDVHGQSERACHGLDELRPRRSGGARFRRRVRHGIRTGADRRPLHALRVAAAGPRLRSSVVARLPLAPVFQKRSRSGEERVSSFLPPASGQPPRRRASIRNLRRLRDIPADRSRWRATSSEAPPGSPLPALRGEG